MFALVTGGGGFLGECCEGFDLIVGDDLGLTVHRDQVAVGELVYQHATNHGAVQSLDLDPGPLLW